MPILPSAVPDLLGGVSREAENLRLPNQFQEMDNVELSPQRGAEKRPGSQFIESADGASANGELTVEEPTNVKNIFWLDRASGEQFVFIIDPSVTDKDKVVQVFRISDGAERTVEGRGQILEGTVTPQALSHAENDELRDYIEAGSNDIRRRLKLLAIEDATFLLNREQVTSAAGINQTIQNSGSDVRLQTNSQNVAAWSDFTQPPSTFDAAFPPRATRKDTAILTNANDAFWYARDNDVGQPQGFYFAVSLTHPPWFLRYRSEPVNSMIDEDTLPIRINFDGVDTFTLEPVDWTDRFSGDSNTNPGPSFLGNAVSDLVLHQDRLFFLSGEQIVSSRAGDLFNMWIDSLILRNDADPIDQTVPGGSANRTNTIDFAISFQDALVALTRGSRQVELRANGPLTPASSFLNPSTAIFTVQYIAPLTMANKMYMMGERDFANIVYEYVYDPQRFANVANEVTTHIRNYIPAEASLWVASEQHDQVYILTDAETNVIYVYRTEDENQAEFEQRFRRRQPMKAWYKWIFDTNTEIMSIQVFDDFLFALIRKDDLVWLEKIPLGIPAQDTDTANGPLQSLGYNIPIDRKTTVAGVYDAGADTTSFTLPYEDSTIDELILGPAWDTDFTEPDGSITAQRLAGVRFKVGINMTSIPFNGQTVLTIEGQHATNINSNTPNSFAGRSYLMLLKFSRQFPRDPQTGQTMQGNFQLMGAEISHKDTGFYTFRVTPQNRDPIDTDFVVPIVGSTLLNSSILDTFGQFQTRIMSASHSVEMEIRNDSPLPSAITEVEFFGAFIPQTKSPVK